MGRCVLVSICMAALALGCSKKEDSQAGHATFDVVITGVGQSKILAIKGVRDVTGLGLKDAKDLVESVPATVKKGLAKEEAEEVAQKLRESDLTVEVRPN